MSALRVVFFGTPDIAVPTLEALIAGSHDVVGVVSQPDRGRGRGRKRSPSAVSEVALREGLPLFRPEKVGDAETVDALDALRPDVGVVVAFGQFIPKKVRELPHGLCANCVVTSQLNRLSDKGFLPAQFTNHPSSC